MYFLLARHTDRVLDCQSKEQRYTWYFKITETEAFMHVCKNKKKYHHTFPKVFKRNAPSVQSTIMFVFKLKSHHYPKYSSTFSMISFARSKARLAWSLVYTLDGTRVPSGYFIFLTPCVSISRSVASRRNSLGSDWARLARSSERLTLLASSMYCQAIRAFSVAFE